MVKSIGLIRVSSGDYGSYHIGDQRSLESPSLFAHMK